VQGVVKIYDPDTGVGVIVREVDRSEVYLRPNSLTGSVFRTLRQGQRVVFDLIEEDGRSYAANIRVGSEGY
jgi:CspA family cold shock protein